MGGCQIGSDRLIVGGPRHVRAERVDGQQENVQGLFGARLLRRLGLWFDLGLGRHWGRRGKSRRFGLAFSVTPKRRKAETEESELYESLHTPLLEPPNEASNPALRKRESRGQGRNEIAQDDRSDAPPRKTAA